ncbi:hypothetical protein [uncultured Desulfosarcina sp.]|uniref:hypothetical protein n=1 Tax=uncultured Desulfosarcina sp. TaxID=218289 RepID=UPI0029C8C425|nr:hypothetical protein [uncultured Desulfosarcina sp.]
MKTINLNKKHFFFVWLSFFCYSMLAAWLFRKAILPLFPSFNAGNGLITDDASYFDSVAYSLAERIHLQGWGEWHVYPAPYAGINVALLGAIYVLFGHHTALMMPVGSALHAMGGVLILILARELGDKTLASTCAGFLAASLYVIFPSALTWFSQNLKDSYMIAGSLLVLLTWIKASENSCRFQDWILLSLYHLIGVMLIAGVRPYNLILLFIATIGALSIVSLGSVVQHHLRNIVKPASFFAIAFITIVVGIKFISMDSVGNITLAGINVSSQKTVHKKPFISNNTITSEITNKSAWRWKRSSIFPQKVENYFKSIAKIRAKKIKRGLKIGAKSTIDEDVQPQSIREVIQYLPRALQVALLAPFPSSWFQETSIQRRIASGEMFIYYLFLPGIFLLFLYNRKPKVFLVIFFACFFLMIYAFAEANLGTLYRHRYGYLFMVLTVGSLGWFTWFEKIGWLKRFEK